MLRIALSIIASFVATSLFMPLNIWFAKKMKANQTILGYVDNHKGKSGTPTFGGVGVILGLIVGSISFVEGYFTLMLVALLVTVGYGIVGFLDDFIKVFFKQNKGLSPVQKVVFQLFIAVIVSVFAFYNENVADLVRVPFFNFEIALGYFAIPLYILVFISFTNGVNLIDGLDGLASKQTIIYTVFFAIIFILGIYTSGQPFKPEDLNLLLFSGAIIGSLSAFMMFNGFPAKIFMGDTGALALGGALGSLAIFTRQMLIAPVLGIMFVLTCVSVILQVVYFKATKKRIFLMAPLHHHFERKGVHENRIVNIYSGITLCVGLLIIIITLLVAA